MKSLNEWLKIYGESHQNKTNKVIHYICVPAIYFTALVLFWSIPTFGLEKTLLLNFATLILVPTMWFYFRLSIKLGLLMTLVSGAMVFVIDWWAANLSVPIIQSAIVIFVIAWIMQFVGHKVEGKKPSFFTDLQFLLIGPAWFLCNWFKIIPPPKPDLES